MRETQAPPAAPAPSGVAAPERSYYSVSEVAALLGVSRVSVWRWITAGRLPVTRLGHRTVRVSRGDLERIGRPARGSPSHPGAASTADGPPHQVLFYDADPFLVARVADFIGAALRAGDRGLLVATPAHRDRVEQQLEAAGVDLRSARLEGRYVAVDAAELLARFMVGDVPDAAKFRGAMLAYLGSATGRRLRIFGEMVSLLVADGNSAGALALEAVWSGLQKEQSFSLLCGYPMEQFGGGTRASLLSDTCAEHSWVVPAESYSALEDGDARLRQVAALQQKAASLEIEIEEHRRTRAQLELALIAERAAHDEAVAALRAREEFLSIASHELRTPITVLGAQAQLSLKRLERNGQLEPELAAQALRTVGSQARKLARLVGQLLDISRLDSGKLTVEPETTDLVALTRQAISASGSLTTRHTITLVAPSAPLEGQLDALRIEQVLTNVLDNAVKYSPEGGVIEVVLRQAAPTSVELVVLDHGLGIPVDKRARIFERFYQAHQNGAVGGLGLGLYVSRQIVELHGGTIRAEFPPDGGTRVTVELPLRPAPPPSARAADLATEFTPA